MNPANLLNGYPEFDSNSLGQAVEAALEQAAPGASVVSKKAARSIAKRAANMGVRRPVSTEEQFLISQVARQDEQMAADLMAGRLFARPIAYYVNDQITAGNNELGSAYTGAVIGRTNLNGRDIPNDALFLHTGVALLYGTDAGTNPGAVTYGQVVRDAANNVRIPAAIQAGEVEVHAGELRVLKTPAAPMLVNGMNGSNDGLTVYKLNSWQLFRGGTKIQCWVRGAQGATLPGGSNHFAGIILLGVELVRR